MITAIKTRLEAAPRAANDNAPLLDRIAPLKDLPGYAYLGTPYSKFPAGQTVANYLACKAAAILMAMGLRVVSPIAHSHAVATWGGIDPMDWAIWKHQDEPLMDAASSLVVLTMETWEDSLGLRHEIATFLAGGKPVVYVDPAELWSAGR
ncbi:DUF1937 family protein [Consotaella salsifontis]|uniref:DUF1937 domain-containing protein n=1 Tax=Consotaella salsifontis TaxID=1365950 RepID=A0A1T4SRV6_9HYPH|nr:DUF1937 family protein [Consotaella salsifontis]SKA30882.1 protein of unknown function [Consotaella salsifontis]